jgi:hypothetical protein
MSMRVVIRLAELQACNACDAYLLSPEWDAKEQALVYPDWDATVARHLAMGPGGIVRLSWLVHNKLVPMTAHELFNAKTKATEKNV